MGPRRMFHLPLLVLSIFSIVSDAVAWLASSLDSLPPLAVVLILMVCALIEYVFPPFPGDVITFSAAFFAADGRLDVVVVWLALCWGSLAGSLTVFYLGYFKGRSFFRKDRPGKRGKIRAFFKNQIFSPQKLQSLERLFEKYGPIVIVANRFLPAIRAFFFLGAGMARMKPWKVTLYSSLSIMAWNTLVIFLGFTVGTNRDRLVYWFSTYQKIILAVLAIIAIVMLVRWWMKRRDLKDRAAGDESSDETSGDRPSDGKGVYNLKFEGVKGGREKMGQKKSRGAGKK